MTGQNGQGNAAPRSGASPLTAALVSLLVPGAGQVLAGRWRRGLGFFLTIAILGALVLALRAALQQSGWLFVAIYLLGGLLAHIADVALRLGATRHAGTADGMASSD